MVVGGENLMKKITFFLIILSIILVICNTFLVVKLMRVSSATLTVYDFHINAISNNSIDMKKQIEKGSFTHQLAYDSLSRFNKDLTELMELTNILSVTNNAKVPLGDLMQYSRFVNQLSKSTDYSSEIKYITILIDDFEKIKISIRNNSYSAIRDELKIIDERYKSKE